MRRWFLCVLLMTGCEGGVAVSRSPIVGGAPDDTYGSVVALVNWERASGGGLCTGTLIAPDVVLTAKHCVWHRDPSDAYVATPIDRLEVRAGPHAVNDIRETRSVLEVVTTPGPYAPARIREGEDLAILRLDAPVAGASPYPLADAAPAVGADATIVGYGFIDAVAPDVGRRYVGETAIDAVDDDLARTLGDAWTCQGDSGGPLFVGGRVAAVTSAGQGGCVRDAMHLYTLVAPHRALIEGVIGPLCTPIEETCDGSDEDCDGLVDETCAADADAGVEPGVDGGAGSADGGAASPIEPEGGCGVGRRGEAGLAWLILLAGSLLRRRRGVV